MISRLTKFEQKLKVFTYSVIESKLLVASSNTKIGVFFKMALAMATLCFSPPDSFRPRSPTCVENLKLETKFVEQIQRKSKTK